MPGPPDRRIVLLLAIAAGAAMIAGLAAHGVTGGAILLLLALGLAVMSAAVRDRLDPSKFTLRALVVMVIAAVGLVKIFHH